MAVDACRAGVDDGYRKTGKGVSTCRVEGECLVALAGPVAGLELAPAVDRLGLGANSA